MECKTQALALQDSLVADASEFHQLLSTPSPLPMDLLQTSEDQEHLSGQPTDANYPESVPLHQNLLHLM